MTISNAVWSPDQKSLYVSALESAGSTNTIWKWSDGSNPEKLVEKCGFAYDADPGGKYLFALFASGEKTGIYEVSISERKCIPLLPGITSGAVFALDRSSIRSETHSVGFRRDSTEFSARLLGTSESVRKRGPAPRSALELVGMLNWCSPPPFVV